MGTLGLMRFGMHAYQSIRGTLAAGGAAGVAGIFPQSHRDIVVGFTGIGMSV
jgi:hypothetical protein